MHKVSFVVPIYKVEDYLKECVDSIRHQSYTNIEIVLVDDGSPDRCPQICDSFALEDNRIKVIHKKNGGLSDARNTGLVNSSGDYIIFVDGDDFWRNKYDLERLMLFVCRREDCDFIGFNCSFYYPESHTFRDWKPYAKELEMILEKDESVCALVTSGIFPVSACMKIIKKEFLIKNQLFFVKGQLSEDIPWFINLLDRCKNCCFINQYIYGYRQNVQGSISNTRGEKNFRSSINILETEVERVEDRSFGPKSQKALYSFWAYELILLLCHRMCNREARKMLNKYLWLLNYDAYPKVKKFNYVRKLFGLEIAIYTVKFMFYRKRHRK